MENKDILIKKFHEGILTEEETSILEQGIAEGLIKLDELEEFQFLVDALNVNENVQPSENMDANFYSMLSQDKEPESKVRFSLDWIVQRGMKLALPAALLVIAFLLGQQYGENDQLASNEERKQDFTVQLLETENISDKINLVSNANIEDETDKKVIEALLFVLNHDESNNVRIACINSLYDFAYLPNVRAGLINAISSQTSPVVLANLAEAINSSGKKISSEEFNAKIKEDLPAPIKSTIAAGLIKI